MTISFSLQNNGHLLLTWTGGRAPYQIQQSSNPSTGWTNLGALTAGKSASLPVAGAENFYRVVSSP